MSYINQQSRKYNKSPILVEDSTRTRKKETSTHKGMPKIEVIKEQKPDKQIPSEPNKRYDEESLHYVNEIFSEKIQRIIRSISRQAYNRESIAFVKKYPITKIFTFFAKKLFFNAMELMFLQYILEENKWELKDETIMRHHHSIKDFMNNTDVADEGQYKGLLLYLALITYSAKYCLNEQNHMQLFQQEYNNLIPNFQNHFKEWSKRNAAVNYKVSPKILNNIFRKLNCKEDRENYFMMVESIIDISPPYNNNADKKDKKPTKDKQQRSVAVAKEDYDYKKQEYHEHSHPQSQQSHQGSNHMLERPITNLSYEDDLELPQLMLQRQGTSMNDGLEDMIKKRILKDNRMMDEE